MGGNPSRARISGPLVVYRAGFVKELEGLHYKPNVVCDQLHLLAHVSRWLDRRGLDVGEFTSECADEFLTARRAEGSTESISNRSLVLLLGHLRAVGAIPPATSRPTTPIDDWLAQFARYLSEERGLAASTITNYTSVARLLAEHFDALNVLTVHHVLDFVAEQCRHYHPAFVTVGLRALLRYGHQQDLMPGSLAQAVPAVASWRLSPLPDPLEPAAVRALLASCDRDTAWGRRDFAILTILLRLGLRAGEVAALRLGDIDWRSGELEISGKGGRTDRLPLPVDVGEAITDWLANARPRCDHANVFCGLRAPRRALSSGGVSSLVRSANRRAGLTGVHAHRLRHSAATEMLRAGSNLREVGQILRHHKLSTTALYAKVDRATLLALAQPWPSAS